MNARNAEKRFKWSTLVLCIILMAVFALLTFGCGNERQGQYVQTSQYTWYQENGVEYRFPNAMMCIVRYGGQEVNIPRNMRRGNYGWISWEWEDDGDIDVEIMNGPNADLDSPFDFDYDGGNQQMAFGYGNYQGEPYEGYEEDPGGLGMVWIWLGGKKVKKHKSWLSKNPKYNKKYTKSPAILAKERKIIASTKTVRTSKGVLKTTQAKDTYGNKVKTSTFTDNNGNKTKTSVVKNVATGRTSVATVKTYPKKKKSKKSSSSKKKK